MVLGESTVDTLSVKLAKSLTLQVSFAYLVLLIINALTWNSRETFIAFVVLSVTIQGIGMLVLFFGKDQKALIVTQAVQSLCYGVGYLWGSQCRIADHPNAAYFVMGSATFLLLSQGARVSHYAVLTILQLVVFIVSSTAVSTCSAGSPFAVIDDPKATIFLGEVLPVMLVAYAWLLCRNHEQRVTNMLVDTLVHGGPSALEAVVNSVREHPAIRNIDKRVTFSSFASPSDVEVGMSYIADRMRREMLNRDGFDNSTFSGFGFPEPSLEREAGINEEGAERDPHSRRESLRTGAKLEAPWNPAIRRISDASSFMDVADSNDDNDDMGGDEAITRRVSLASAAVPNPLAKRMSLFRPQKLPCSPRPAGPAPQDGAGIIRSTDQWVVLFTLPKLRSRTHQASSLPMVLSNFLRNVQRVVADHSGIYMMCCLGDLYARFDTLQKACDAAQVVCDDARNLSSINAEEESEMPLVLVAAGQVTSVVVTQNGQNSVMGWSSVVRHLQLLLLQVTRDGCLSNLPEAVISPAVEKQVARLYTLTRLIAPDRGRASGDGTGREIGYLLGAKRSQPLASPQTSNPGDTLDNESFCPDFADLIDDNEPGDAEAMRVMDEYVLGTTLTSQGRSVTGTESRRASGASLSSTATGLSGSRSRGTRFQKTQTMKNLRRMELSTDITTRGAALPHDVLAAWVKVDKQQIASISFEEFRSLMRELYLPDHIEAETLFREAGAEDDYLKLDVFVERFFSTAVGGQFVMALVRHYAKLMEHDNGFSNIPIVLNVWKKYDPDVSRELTPDELGLILEDLGFPQGQQEVQLLAQALDKDLNGVISFEEFIFLFSEEELTDTRTFRIKRKIQDVKRTMLIQNECAGKVYANAEQTIADRRVKVKYWVEYMTSWPFFIYIAYNLGRIGYAMAVTNLVVNRRDEYGVAERVINYLLDGIFLWTWMGLKLFYIPRDRKGHLLCHTWDICRDYVSSPGFFLDLLVALPIDLVGTMASVSDILYPFLRANKLLLVFRINPTFIRIARLFNIPPSIASVLKAYVLWACTCHATGCMFIAWGQDAPLEDLEAMVTATMFSPSEREKLYTRSFDWSLKTMSGQIKGDNLPTDDSILVMQLLTIFIGLPLFTLIIGTFTQAIETKSAYTQYLGLLDDLRGFFMYTHLPRKFEDECIGYYTHLHASTGMCPMGLELLDELPDELRIRIVVDLGQLYFGSVPMFKTLMNKDEIVHELTERLQPMVLDPGECLIQLGELGNEMYFLTYGELWVLNENMDVVFVMKKGAFFGESAMLDNTPRTATIIAHPLKYANILGLPKTSFDEVLNEFPDTLVALLQDADSVVAQRKKSFLPTLSESTKECATLLRSASFHRSAHSFRRGSNSNSHSRSFRRHSSDAGPTGQ